MLDDHVGKGVIHSRNASWVQQLLERWANAQMCESGATKEFGFVAATEVIEDFLDRNVREILDKHRHSIRKSAMTRDSSKRRVKPMDIVEKNSRADQVSQPHPTAFHQFLRVVRFESISIITVFFALVVTRGYAHLEKVDLILGVPTWRVGYDSLIYAIYGGVSFTFLITGVGAGTTLALALLFVVTLFERPPLAKPPKRDFDKNSIRYRLQSALPLLLGAFFVGLFSILLWLVIGFMVEDAQKSAIIVAYELIEKCSEATLTLKNTDKVTGCIVAETDDMLYLIKRTSKGRHTMKFSKIMQPKSALDFSIEPAELTKSI